MALVAAGWPLTAGADVYKLSGNARFQIGDGLPIPAGFTAAPTGKIKAKQTARVEVSSGGKMTVEPGAFTYPAQPFNLPVLLANPVVAQVRTNLSFSFPQAPIVFSAGKRTGANTVSFCPGDVVTSNGNPGCPGPDVATNNTISHPMAGLQHGRLIYTRTAAQFGGSTVGSVDGTATVAVKRGTHNAPCGQIAGGGPADPECRIQFALANPAATAAFGQAFGGTGATNGTPVPNPGHFTAQITLAGKVLALGNTFGNGLGTPNPATSYGAPWTTGNITVEVTLNTGANDEVFMLNGSDSRNNGVGNISLVSGALGNRAVTGLNGNRGWLNLTISPVIPSMTGRGMAASIVLMLLAGGYALRRWTRS